MLEHENRNTLELQRALLPGDDGPLLPPLENNIQCGNSLIASDFSMIPDNLIRVRAFDWDVGFKEIMKAGGFDAIIANPPYSLLQPRNIAKEELDYYHRKFRGAQYKVDIYHLFIEQSLRLIGRNGHLGFITPAPFTTNNYTTNLRKLILDSVRIRQLVTVADGVFEQASVDNAIFAFQKCEDEHGRTANKIDFVEADAGKASIGHPSALAGFAVCISRDARHDFPAPKDRWLSQGRSGFLSKVQTARRPCTGELRHAASGQAQVSRRRC